MLSMKEKHYPQYYNEYLNSCTLDQCIEKAMEMIDWKNKPLVRDMGDFTRGLGIACSMQGSGYFECRSSQCRS